MGCRYINTNRPPPKGVTRISFSRTECTECRAAVYRAQELKIYIGGRGVWQQLVHGRKVGRALSYNLAYTATEAAAATNGGNSRRRRYAARFYPQIADWPALECVFVYLYICVCVRTFHLVCFPFFRSFGDFRKIAAKTKRSAVPRERTRRAVPSLAYLRRNCIERAKSRALSWSALWW